MHSDLRNRKLTNCRYSSVKFSLQYSITGCQLKGPHGWGGESHSCQGELSTWSMSRFYYWSHCQELTTWLSNKWQMTKGCSRKLNKFKVKRSEAIYSLYKDWVFKEIGNLLGVEDATTSTPGWFQMWLPAIKSIFDSMTAEEKAMLETEQDKMMQEGCKSVGRGA